MPTTAVSAGHTASFLRQTDELAKCPERLFKELATGRLLPGKLLFLFVATVVFSAPFGMATGAYIGGLQVLITGCKIPAMLLLTLVVCFLLMHMVSQILGAKLALAQTLGIALISISVTALVLFGWSPVVLLFSLTLKFREPVSYQFLLALSLFCVATAAIVSLRYLYMGLRAQGLGGRQMLTILVSWVVIYQFVGSQVTWILRPFVGSSADKIRFEGNFYEYLPILFKALSERLTG